MLDRPRHGAANETCPWSGKPVRPDGLTLYRGRVVGFCNPGCRDKFDAATTRFDAALDREAGPTLLALAGARPVAPGLEDAVLVVVDAGVTAAFRQPTISLMMETTLPENADSIWKTPP